MFNRYRRQQHNLYLQARHHLITNSHQLLELESYISSTIYNLLQNNITEIISDYNEASYLYPFWQNYPPDERGRQPRGDQYPWLEVGEHSIGCKLPRILESEFNIRDSGLPTGSDQRFILKNKRILELTNNFTDSCWLFIDIKSVGPRDDKEHAVMSHNQVSGNGSWISLEDGIKNDIIIATGSRKSHPFHCSIPPIYILSDNTIAPVILIVIKPVYKMLSLDDSANDRGQPLGRITLATIPNGLLLQENPNYLLSYPGLFFPGKDDKSKNPLKLRCRVSFDILRILDDWRVQTIEIPNESKR